MWMVELWKDSLTLEFLPEVAAASLSSSRKTLSTSRIPALTSISSVSSSTPDSVFFLVTRAWYCCSGLPRGKYLNLYSGPSRWNPHQMMRSPASFTPRSRGRVVPVVMIHHIEELTPLRPDLVAAHALPVPQMQLTTFGGGDVSLSCDALYVLSRRKRQLERWFTSDRLRGAGACSRMLPSMRRTEKEESSSAHTSSITSRRSIGIGTFAPSSTSASHRPTSSTRFTRMSASMDLDESVQFCGHA